MTSANEQTGKSRNEMDFLLLKQSALSGPDISFDWKSNRPLENLGTSIERGGPEWGSALGGPMPPVLMITTSPSLWGLGQEIPVLAFSNLK